MLHNNKRSKPFVRYLDGGGTLDNQPLNRMEDNRFIKHDGKLPANRMSRSQINLLKRKRKSRKKKSNQIKYKLKKRNGFNKHNNKNNNSTESHYNLSDLHLNNNKNNNIDNNKSINEDLSASASNVIENMMNINLNDLNVFNLCKWILLLPTYKQYYLSQDKNPCDKINNYQNYDLYICRSLSNFLYENQIDGKTLNRYKNIDWFHDLMNCLYVKEHKLYNGIGKQIKQLQYEYNWIFECICQCEYKNKNKNNNSMEWINKSWTKYMIKYENDIDNLFINLSDLNTHQLSEWIKLLPKYQKNNKNIEICNELSQIIVVQQINGKCIGEYDKFKENDFFNMIKCSKLNLKQDNDNNHKNIELTYGWIWDRIHECQLIAQNSKLNDNNHKNIDGKSTPDTCTINECKQSQTVQINNDDEQIYMMDEYNIKYDSNDSDAYDKITESKQSQIVHINNDDGQINVMDEYNIKYELHDSVELEWKAELLFERIKKIEFQTEKAQTKVNKLNSRLAKQKYKVKYIQKQMEKKLNSFEIIKQTNKTLKLEMQRISNQSISITK